ncbi:hypothetical protein [Actinoplanes sp. NBRC 103695]|uniref:hypothetical protein n=1 Tax=Actinoplanes sp. NBRC 103695 TaxID=3032202 RepID=UPI0024A15D3F|nr:hypothetical protein [Actinoplanes sp. NBRC 103695]GLY96566.1 hypothetical protein Acsp02_38210 [Actinoplanes sp. NBRC 103695]
MTSQHLTFGILIVVAAVAMNATRQYGMRLGVPALTVSALVAGTAYAIKRLA